MVKSYFDEKGHCCYFIHTFLSFYPDCSRRVIIVPSGSMEPTLLCGDRVWIDKITYGARFPAKWADIPVINVFTWIRPLREMDRNTHWKYR